MTAIDLTRPTTVPTGELPPRLRIGCHFCFDAPVDTHAVVIVEPHESEGRRVISERFTAPGSTPRRRTAISSATSAGESRCRPVAASSASTRSSPTTTASTSSALTPGSDRPPSCPTTRWCSCCRAGYCPSDELAAAALERFGSVAPGWGRAAAIAEWVHDHVTFAYGSSSPTKTAADVLADGRGVCRDFAHLLVACARALNIPARYVVGYLPDIAVPDPGTPMDFCAWTEVYVGDRWYTFDPRNHGQRRVGRTVIARGRDAADVAMTTTFGSAALVSMTVRAEPAT